MLPTMVISTLTPLGTSLQRALSQAGGWSALTPRLYAGNRTLRFPWNPLRVPDGGVIQAVGTTWRPWVLPPLYSGTDIPPFPWVCPFVLDTPELDLVIHPDRSPTDGIGMCRELTCDAICRVINSDAGVRALGWSGSFSWLPQRQLGSSSQGLVGGSDLTVRPPLHIKRRLAVQ